MPTSFYDVLVLGDDLAGIIAGALCARRGLRVLIAETDATPPEKYTLGPYTLPRAPLPFVIDSSPAVKRVLGELNFVQSFKRRLSPLRPFFQLILPDARIDVGPEPETLLSELDRELALEKPLVEAFLARAQEISNVLEPVLGQDISFPPAGFWERRELRYSHSKLPTFEVFKDLGEDNPIRSILALPAAFTLPLDPRTLSTAAIARSFDLWRRGTFRLQGGRDALRSMLIEKLRTQHAGEVRKIHPSGLLTKWGRVQGLSVREKEESIGMTSLLAALHIAELGDLFGERWPKRVMELSQAIRPTAYRYVLNMVVDECGIPEGIAPISFAVIDPKAPLLGDNALAIYINERDDNARVVITVVANAPAPGDRENLDDVLSALRPKIKRRVEELLPFSSDHIVLVHSPNQERSPEGLATTNLPPIIPPEPLWSSALPATLGVSALPYAVGVKNITTASTQNLPGLGLEGEFAAGWCAARQVCGASKKQIDYLKEEVVIGQ